jgi:histone H3/H4
LKEIRYYGKHSNELIFARAPFKRVVQEIIQTNLRLREVRVTQEALVMLQMVAEKYLGDTFELAYIPFGSHLIH